jgi:hypothetical protein
LYGSVLASASELFNAEAARDSASDLGLLYLRRIVLDV